MFLYVFDLGMAGDGTYKHRIHSNNYFPSAKETSLLQLFFLQDKFSFLANTATGIRKTA